MKEMCDGEAVTNDNNGNKLYSCIGLCVAR